MVIGKGDISFITPLGGGRDVFPFDLEKVSPRKALSRASAPQIAMREHLLCPSTEGCHVLARPWSEPLADFAVEEFLALHGLFTREARSAGEIDDGSSPLGNSEETEAARARMRHSTGPSPVKRPMSEAVASRIGSRLVAGTLHEILCEGRDRETLRRAIVALEEASREKKTRGNADDGAKTFFSSRPHALLMRFPGATAANGGGPLASLGAKARKKWLLSCVAGTWLDPERDDETDGCGSSEKKTEKPFRTHACVAWVNTRRAFCLTRPVAAEAALRYVCACTPGGGGGGCRGKSSSGKAPRREEEEDDEKYTREYRAAPASPALAAIVSNLARVERHSVTFDPFAGTGGLLAPAIALGAPFALGADVRPVPGSDPPGSEEARLGFRDVVAANAFSSPLRRCTDRGADAESRRSFLFDAIVCDPPYGLRAPRIANGSASKKDAPLSSAAEMERAASETFMRPVFASAADALRVGGRLVFLAPTHRSASETETFGEERTEGDRGADLAERRARREGRRGGKNGRYDFLSREFPGLRFVGACAQEFKGMTRSARVYERVA